ncbi:MAG TPA: peptidoglycan bridge formation glycyltransferase FemA/FemB family protein [Anaerolineales bacterium]|nr:peptidoglycan bridge formation glycyltransferase FemA/FemB family protein [Anaerolineales bacterium]
MALLSSSAWSAFIAQNLDTHLLQTAAWGDFKAAFGWDVLRLEAGEGSFQVGAQVLFRRLPLGFSFAYIPKGPVTKQPPSARTEASSYGWGLLLPELDKLCRSRRAIFLKVEPDRFEIPGEGSDLPAGFRQSAHAIQPRRTLVVDLSGDEEQNLARMKQKTRYNIRLALKKGVLVRPTRDIELFYHLIQQTGQRDRFGVHTLEYYRQAYENFHPRGQCELLLAEFEGQPLGGLMVFTRGSRAWYFYGASTDLHRDRMPTYLLQWEAMRWARHQGCTTFDLWGVPDYPEEILEAQFVNRTDGLWGVYRFKRGFNGQLLRSAGPWDRVYQPFLYRLYLWWSARKTGD